MAGKALDRSLLHGESIEQFRAAIRNAATRDPYERRLVRFLEKLGMTPDEFVAEAKSRPDGVEKRVISYVCAENCRSEKGEITAGTVGNALKAVKLLLEMNDAPLNGKRLNGSCPRPEDMPLTGFQLLTKFRVLLKRPISGAKH